MAEPSSLTGSRAGRKIVRVIKVGGSLFADPQLPRKFSAWLGEQESACNLVLTGGGRLADEIRELDKRFTLPPETSHMLAIRAMQTLAETLREALASAGGTSTWLTGESKIQQLAESNNRLTDAPQAIVFVDPIALMQWDARSDAPLPASWDVTSDTIAARVANTAKAGELVLLKSAPPPTTELSPLATSGYIDPCFQDEVSAWVSCGGKLTFATLG